jgi:hypothetical protein
MSDGLINAILWEYDRQATMAARQASGGSMIQKTPELNRARKRYLEIYAQIAGMLQDKKGTTDDKGDVPATA